MSTLGNFSTVTLAQNSSSTVTTWYLPIYDYTGSVYVSQINSSGKLLGSCVWSNISAFNNGFSTSYNSSNFSTNPSTATTMAVGYNTNAANLGLEFTNVDLTSYSLCVTYVGMLGGGLTFTFSNPSSANYTITNGNAPTVKTDNSTYTSLEFYGTTTLTFGQPVTLLDLGTAISGYTSYMLNGTSDKLTAIASGTSGGTGATCYALASGAGLPIAAGAIVTITTGKGTVTTITVAGAPITGFTAMTNGGSGYNNGAAGGGGGSAGPGGAGLPSTSLSGGAPASSTTTTYKNIGNAGQTSTSSTYGAGGSATNSLTIGQGSVGGAVLTLYGYYVNIKNHL